jgi:hypothetical protein
MSEYKWVIIPDEPVTDLASRYIKPSGIYPIISASDNIVVLNLGDTTYSMLVADSPAFQERNVELTLLKSLNE